MVDIHVQNNGLSQKEKIISSALQTISVEAEVLENLKSEINDEFARCITDIFNCNGRLVVTGIGKSALVAQKIVATLNSTGTSALFMHAADAVHGDMGMIGEHDFLLCLSKSGESPEIKVLIPFIQSMGNPIIAMVSNKDSFLAKKANYVLHIPISKEADPNNLAPTSSTTAQMAMGDAIAIALLALRGFTPNDFAKYHPGGALGKQLYLKAEDVSQSNERPVVLATDNIRKVILEISTKRLGATAVLDEHDHLIGIITDGDLRRMLEEKQDVSELTAKDIMTNAPKIIQKDALAIEALRIIKAHSINQLPVLDGENYFGMIHLHDLIKEGLI
jgi:arabinose-5-phosphate isomerase